jgi:hypothetical protein
MALFGIAVAGVGHWRKSTPILVTGAVIFTLAFVFIFPNLPLATRRMINDSWVGVKTFFTNAVNGNLSLSNWAWLLGAVAALVAAAALGKQKKWVFVVVTIGIFIFAMIQNFPNFGSSLMTWITTAFSQPNFKA